MVALAVVVVAALQVVVERRRGQGRWRCIPKVGGHASTERRARGIINYWPRFSFSYDRCECIDIRYHREDGGMKSGILNGADMRALNGELVGNVLS